MTDPIPDAFQEAGRVAERRACVFCKRGIGDEFFFQCLRSGASYCYIHMSRHNPSLCPHEKGVQARQTPKANKRAEVVPFPAISQFLLAKGRKSGHSANV